MDTTLNRTPLLSLVTPMYNEEQGMEAFFRSTVSVLETITDRWEIICVDDGSRDATLPMLRHRHAEEPRIRYLSLSRNFGKEAALTAGLDYAAGDAVIPIDADLQDPPELIAMMVQEWRKGFKVVLATRRRRTGEGWFKRLSAKGFYRLISRVATVPIPENTGDFRLLDRQVVEVIRRLPERTRFMKGLFAWAGFSTTRLYYDRPARAAGAAKYNLQAMWRHAKDGIFSFTTLPLRISAYLGAIISMGAIAYAGYIILRTLVRGADLPGYASLITAVLFMGGIQLVSLGIIGEYIGRIYRETKQRPIYVLKEQSL
ncbi:MAG: glycosyltransferase family 2 protein [Alphaproteobacteria bacterium]|nr:glycosyltransferase family 2 protein [Alphaproteobacteria bacterium]